MTADSDNHNFQQCVRCHDWYYWSRLCNYCIHSHPQLRFRLFFLVLSALLLPMRTYLGSVPKVPVYDVILLRVSDALYHVLTTPGSDHCLEYETSSATRRPFN